MTRSQFRGSRGVDYTEDKTSITPFFFFFFFFFPPPPPPPPPPPKKKKKIISHRRSAENGVKSSSRRAKARGCRRTPFRRACPQGQRLRTAAIAISRRGEFPYPPEVIGIRLPRGPGPRFQPIGMSLDGVETPPRDEPYQAPSRGPDPGPAPHRDEPRRGRDPLRGHPYQPRRGRDPLTTTQPLRRSTSSPRPRPAHATRSRFVSQCATPTWTRGASSDSASSASCSSA